MEDGVICENCQIGSDNVLISYIGDWLAAEKISGNAIKISVAENKGVSRSGYVGVVRGDKSGHIDIVQYGVER